MRKRYIFLIASVVLGGLLLLLVDVDAGLPMINMVVWPAVFVAGVLLLMRQPTKLRRRRHRRSSLRHHQERQQRLTHGQPKSLPRRHH